MTQERLKGATFHVKDDKIVIHISNAYSEEVKRSCKDLFYHPYSNFISIIPTNRYFLQVKRVLPKWLSNPTVISVNLQNLQTKVSGMKCLDKQLRAKLKANGIKKFFPVQAEVIPWLLGSNSEADVFIPRDVCVSAPTGSGKTLAFVLPVVQVLKKCTVKKIRALVLLPTQHLALQIYGTFKEYTEGTGLDVGLVTGKVPFAAEQKQIVGESKMWNFYRKE